MSMQSNFMGNGSKNRGVAGGYNQNMTGENVIPKGYSSGRLNQFNPEQMNLFKSLFGQVGEGSYLSRLAGGDQSGFEEMEAPAMRQFQELQGDIGSRFSNMGMGARKGSGFRNTMNQATSDFAQDLQSRRQNLQRQAIMDMMGMSESLLGQRPYEQFLTKKSQPFWKQLLLGASEKGSELAPQMAKFAMMG